MSEFSCASSKTIARSCGTTAPPGFKGFRLRPNIWRVLGHLPDLDQEGLTLEQIASILELKKQEGGPIAPLLPRARLVEALLSVLPRRRLDALLKRHAAGGDVDPSRPGVPDLFLFKRSRDPRGVKFVEVKRSREPLKPHQEAEIRFMRSIGVEGRSASIRTGAAKVEAESRVT